MQWNKKDIDGSLVRGLSERFGMDLLAASILVRRGITDPESLRFFFEQDLRFLHMPFHFAEMEDAVERIEQARYQKERVFVFGDRDVDGITSIVVLYHALTSIGLDTVWSLPTEDEPYGLTRKAVDDCLGQGASLIITVDCGISNSEEVAYAAEQGVDVIILDHHNPQDRIPDAVAIINPKMEDSGYPFRDLSGCAVAYKVAWALRFARSEMYNHPICLMNIIPANDTFEIHAVKFMNLVETDRIIENINPGMVTLEQTRLARFLEGHEIYVYQAGTQIPMLRKLFGKQVLVQALDAAPEIWKEFPA
ncbi:MAG: single-stranded-DNA-specific exonuclease RecJ, partial [Spirochaetales bacterium]